MQPAGAGAVPGFDGATGAVVHDRVREEMREVLRSNSPIVFLDDVGQKLLEEARENYCRFDLEHNWILQSGGETKIVLWRGDCVNDTLLLMLLGEGFQGMNEGICIGLKDTVVEFVLEKLRVLSSQISVDPVQLAATVENKFREKWDQLLPPDLLNASFASSCVDVKGVHDALAGQIKALNHEV